MEPGANAQSISRRRLEAIVSVGALRATAATDRSTAALPFRHKFHLGEIPAGAAVNTLSRRQAGKLYTLTCHIKGVLNSEIHYACIARGGPPRDRG